MDRDPTIKKIKNIDKARLKIVFSRYEDEKYTTIISHKSI